MSLRSILPLLGLLLLAPSVGWGQPILCDFQGNRTSQVDMGGGMRMNIFHDPFTLTCDDGTTVRADSGQAISPGGEIQGVGNVYFSDPVQTLTADEASYNRQTARLYARGNVNLVNSSEGRTLIGPELEYFRENETREEALVFATQRPTLIIEPRDSAGNPRADAQPLTLIGDRINVVGNDDLTSTGNVVITQEDLTARGEEAHYDSTNETLELRQDALISREGSALSGEVIQAQLVEGSLQHVQSRTGARLDGEDLTVAAPDIQLFFESDTLQQVIARVPSEMAGERARAASRTFRTEADSIDAQFIAGALDIVYAIGAARGETIDTLQAGADDLEMVTIADVSADSVASVEPSEAPAPSDAAEGAAGAPPIPLNGIDAAEPAGAPDDADADAADDDDADNPAEGSGLPGDPAAPPSPESIAAVTASDWIRGDTIIALFTRADSTTAQEAAGEAAGDSPSAAEPAAAESPGVAPAVELPGVAPAVCETEPCPDAPAAEDRQTPKLRKLIARFEAQSFYRLAAENSSDPNCRNLSFLVGDEIELDVVNGELEVANVRGLEQGIYLEAANCAVVAPPTEPGEDELAPIDSADDEPAPADGQTPDPAETPPLPDTAMIRPWE